MRIVAAASSLALLFAPHAMLVVDPQEVPLGTHGVNPQGASHRVPLPQGVAHHAYPWVAPEDRTDVIELVEEVVYVGMEPTRRTRVDMAGIAVDELGRVYVGRPFEGGVDVFDADGAPRGKLGVYSPGAKGFIMEARSIVATGNEVFAVERYGTLSAWTSDGTLRGEYPLENGGANHAIAATETGEVVMMQRRGIGQRARRRLFSVTSNSAEEVREYFALGYDEAATMTIGDRRFYDLYPWGGYAFVPRDRPSFAAFRDGTAYASDAGAYEIVAKSPDGEVRWAVDVPVTARRFTPTQVHLDRITYQYAYHPPDDRPQPEDIRWPEYEPVIERIDVDGDGNLYVFPWFDAVTRRGEPRPVDVYAPDGRRILAAWIPEFDWQAARDDHVYGVQVDPFTYVATAVRYRLVLPGGP